MVLVPVAAFSQIPPQFNYPKILTGADIAVPGVTGQVIYNGAGSLAATPILMVNTTSTSMEVSGTGSSSSGLLLRSNPTNAYVVYPAAATLNIQNIGAEGAVNFRRNDTSIYARFNPANSNVIFGLNPNGANPIATLQVTGTAVVNSWTTINTGTAAGYPLEVGGATTAPVVSASSLVMRPGTTGAAPYACAVGVRGAMALASNSLPMFCNGSTWTNASGGAATW